MSVEYGEYYETAYPCKIRLTSGKVVLLSEEDILRGVLQFWIPEGRYSEFKEYLMSRHNFVEEQWWPGKYIAQGLGVEEVYLARKLDDVWYLEVKVYRAEYLKGYLVEPIVMISRSYVRRLIESGYIEKGSENEICAKCWCRVFYEFLPFAKEFLNGKVYVYDIKHRDWVEEILQNYRIRIEKPNVVIARTTRPAVILGIIAGAILGIATALILSSVLSKPEEKES